MSKRINNKGFTLIELLAVMFILVIITLIAIPNITSTLNRNNQKLASLQRNIITSQSEEFISDHKNASYYSSFKNGNCSITTSMLKHYGYITSDDLKDNDGNYITGCVIYSDNKYSFMESNCPSSCEMIADTYTVYLNPNGGTLSNQVKQMQVVYGGEYGSLPNPERLGYIFKGWYSEKDGGELVTNTTNMSQENDHTIYAHWEIITYTISYDDNVDNEVINVPNPQAKIYGVPLTLDTMEPVRKGYTFKGWASTSTASSSEFAAGGTYLDNGNVTLYAVWSSNDTTAPICSLSANSTTISATVSDNIGVAYQGWDTSYSGFTTKSISAGTHTYYVKDAAGNTGTCSITITSTTANTTYSCSDSSYTLSGSTCSKKVIGTYLRTDYGGSCLCYDCTNNNCGVCTSTGCNCGSLSIANNYCWVSNVYYCSEGTLMSDGVYCQITKDATATTTYSCSIGTKIDNNYCYY